MIEIIDILSTEYSATPPTPVRAHLIADAASDLPTPTGITGYQLKIGSICDVIADSTRYMMQSSGTWVQVLSDITADTYTKAQIDAMIAGTYTKSQTDALIEAEAAARASADDLRPTSQQVFGIGTSLVTNDDLSAKTTPGVYTCNTSTIASTLSNCPTSLPFRMEVTTSNGSTRYLQVIYAPSYTNNLVYQYIRAYTASGWTTWTQYQMIY